MNSLYRFGFLLLTTLVLVVVIGMIEPQFLMKSELKTSVLEEAWGQAGSIAYQASAKTMRSKNSKGVPLDNLQKRYLQDNYVDYLDQVTIIYNAQMMDRWVFGDLAVHLGKLETIAQTYCDRIYLRDPYRGEDIEQLAILVHEMVHVRQCEQEGGLDQFGYQYFVQYKRANQKYKENPLEQEAYDMQTRFVQKYS